MVENNNSESSGNIFVSSCDSSNKTSRNSKCINVNNSTPKISASKNSKCKNAQNLVLSSCLTDSDSEDEPKRPTRKRTVISINFMSSFCNLNK